MFATENCQTLLIDGKCDRVSALCVKYRHQLGDGKHQLTARSSSPELRYGIVRYPLDSSYCSKSCSIGIHSENTGQPLINLY